MFVIAGIKARELKYEQADVLAERLARTDKRMVKQFRIEETFVGLAGAGTVTRQVGKLLDRDFINYPKGELEIRRHLGNEAAQVFLIGELLKRGVHAHRFEHLGVFTQAIPLKPRRGHLAAILVPCRRVKLAEPALIFPTRRARLSTGSE